MPLAGTSPPAQVIALLGKYLKDPKDLGNAACVNKTWNQNLSNALHDGAAQHAADKAAAAAAAAAAESG